MDDKLSIELLTKENEILKEQRDKYRELLFRQTENSLVAIKTHNVTIRWFLVAFTIIVLWNIGWLLGGYFFSSYQDHNVVNNNSNNTVSNSDNAINSK